ncbi:MAG: NAD(P)-dependent oxidoreductase [Rhodospirillaceae bacterium]|jgi:3-hydroxyisobutyrate dehydrogenase-like beta-hydroxyacid dehydrogenase|nr:NAD(P)-dependent oxidoreductase [Rhodospirillales bacterium]MBT3908007.1 NAD(P)-dependent oxidoreductase [Rhodospirillaceae bacterium]MBT4702197.1 NAD(P)-dependent oxidoreductase [Rhodospirillaceae bacterium]MBT5036634.1 NAD(P)-dependent oxidoreductase [Rhodospirillaceae bacterium]MBT6220864.1 NAD(P)-dependent oxidoreductase [Rhodospirillaceae bacterium]
MTNTIGIIGLGNMGGAISTNLVKSGFAVAGFDIDAGMIARAQSNGVDVKFSATEVANLAKIIILSLASPAALHAVTTELAEAGNKEAILVETGTLTIDDKEAARDRLAAAGITLLDCPLSGTGHQARTGDLVVFTSGDEDAVNKCMPMFAGFSRSQKYCGEFGNGIRMKIVANHLIAVHNTATAEAMVLGMKADLDPNLVFDVISESAGTSRMFEVRGKLMADSNWDDVGATNLLFKKDLDVITNYAAEIGCPVPLFSLAAQPFRAAMSRGLEQRDTASVCLLLEEAAGIDRDNWPPDAKKK